MTETIKTKPGLVAQQRFTKPPPRYSDVSLMTQLDKLEILRPSMANGAIPKLLKERGYIKTSQGSLESTEKGEAVIDFLIKAGFSFVDPNFTAAMEELLDAVSEGKDTRLHVLTDFHQRLMEDIERAKSMKEEMQATDFKCPLCESPLRLKHSKMGPFFSCSKWSKDGGCQYKADVGPNGEPVAKQPKAPVEIGPYPCPVCEGKMVLRSQKKTGKGFYGCAKFPACRGLRELDGTAPEPKKGGFKKGGFKKGFKKK